jgi:hypothetical protein
MLCRFENFAAVIRGCFFADSRSKQSHKHTPPKGWDFGTS